MTQACDAHRPILRVVFNFIGYSHALYATRYEASTLIETWPIGSISDAMVRQLQFVQL
jgi:hypothetical protein